MLDLVQAQKDMLQLLLSSTQLASINFTLQREMQLQASVNVASVWTTPRNGCQGIGGIVEMPTASFDESSVRGPILDWIFSIHILEVPLLNFATAQTLGGSAQGSGISAEQVVQMVLDEVHLYADERLATFQAMSKPVAPANLESIAIGYRVAFTLKKGKSQPTTRTGQVQVTSSIGHVSFACAVDPAAPIWYTTDGSFPANSQTINPTSTLYIGGNIAVASGSTVRARAYASGKIGSATTYTVVP